MNLIKCHSVVLVKSQSSTISLYQGRFQIETMEWQTQHPSISPVCIYLMDQWDMNRTLFSGIFSIGSFPLLPLNTRPRPTEIVTIKSKGYPLAVEMIWNLGWLSS